jgi:hypothetical protein
MDYFKNQRPTWAAISLVALRNNYLTLKEHLIPARS